MSTETEICNRALRLAGGQQISSLDDKTQSARDCKAFYPEARDQTLRDFDWNFARKRLRLAQVEIPDGYGQYEYMYAYPPDCLEIIELRSEMDDVRRVNRPAYRYEIAALQDDSKVIMTNMEHAILVYAARVTDTERFDAGCTEAIVLLLAAKLTWAITRDKDKELSAYRKYTNYLSKAKTADSEESKPEPIQRDTWLTARRGGGSVRFQLFD